MESDEPQVTVNQRFEVFFPEKRPFFLENATFFKTPINLLFTRRIVDPQYGVRMTGKLGHYALGAFFADDRGPGLAVANTDALFGTRAYNGILRVSRDFFRESTVGLFFADREYEGSFNRILGPDLRWKFKPNWILSGQAIASDTLTLDGKKFNGPAYFANLSRSGRSFNYSAEYDDISPNFQAADGFIPRVDLRQVQQYARGSGAGVFNNHIARTKLNYQFTPPLSVRTILQYQSTLTNPSLTSLRTTRRFTGDLLFTYLVHPGKVLYVGYNDILDNPDPRLLLLNRPARPPRMRFLETRHEFFVKFSYLFRFY